MAYQMTVTLTDDEYSTLKMAAIKSGKPLEALLHEALAQYSKRSTPSLTRKDIQEYLYHAGLTERIPTNEPDTQEDEAEQEYLARLFGQGKPASEMVIEDRGPY